MQNDPHPGGMPAKLVELIVKTGLATLPGCGIRGDWIPVVSLVPHSTTGYRMGCLQHRQSRLPHLDPSRIGAFSRWLSEATPPDDGAQNDPHPGGVPAKLVEPIVKTGLATLPGCGIRGDWVPVVSLVPHSTTGYRMGCLRHR